MDKIVFKDGYFKNIKKLSLRTIPLDGIGTFKYVIKVTYQKWYKLSEKIETTNKDQAETLFTELTNIMNNSETLLDVIQDEQQN